MNKKTAVGIGSLVTLVVGSAVAIVATNDTSKERAYYRVHTEKHQLPKSVVDSILIEVPSPEISDKLFCTIEDGNGFCTWDGWDKVTDQNIKESLGKEIVIIPSGKNSDLKSIDEARKIVNQQLRINNQGMQKQRP